MPGDTEDQVANHEKSHQSFLARELAPTSAWSTSRSTNRYEAPQFGLGNQNVFVFWDSTVGADCGFTQYDRQERSLPGSLGSRRAVFCPQDAPTRNDGSGSKPNQSSHVPENQTPKLSRTEMRGELVDSAPVNSLACPPVTERF